MGIGRLADSESEVANYDHLPRYAWWQPRSLVSSFLGHKNDDLAFMIAGFFVFDSGLSWIAYAILRVGWAPVVGIS